MSQEDLALDASVNRTYVSDLEREVYSASLDLVDKLALALGVDPLDLLRKPAGLVKDKLVPRSKSKAR